MVEMMELTTIIVKNAALMIPFCSARLAINNPITPLEFNNADALHASPNVKFLKRNKVNTEMNLEANPIKTNPINMNKVLLVNRS